MNDDENLAEVVHSPEPPIVSTREIVHVGPNSKYLINALIDYA